MAALAGEGCVLVAVFANLRAVLVRAGDGTGTDGVGALLRGCIGHRGNSPLGLAVLGLNLGNAGKLS